MCYPGFDREAGTAKGFSIIFCGTSLPSHSKNITIPTISANNITSHVAPPTRLLLRTIILESLCLAKCFPVGRSRYIGFIAMASVNTPKRNRIRTNAVTISSKPIVLVGMMGVGKTSIGKKLAERIGIPFVDADDEIEKAADLKISEIFEKFGEEYFRNGERRVITRLVNGIPKVIATGGGAFINLETRALIKERALSIWLNADLDILVERVSRRNHRPLLHGKDPREVLLELGQIREPIYAEADIHVCSDASPHAKTVDQIMEAINA
jgi:shikimate kinase